MKHAHISSVITACVLGVSLAQCFGQGTLKITFDGPPAQPPGTQYGVTNYYESGMIFTPIDTSTPGSQFTRNGGGISFYPDDGTPYLQAAGGDTLTFSFTNGALFGLTSVDLAGYSSSVPDFQIDFTGYLSGGGTLTNTFSGSGINFLTYSFGAQFTGLNFTRVEIATPDWSLDNLLRLA